MTWGPIAIRLVQVFSNSCKRSLAKCDFGTAGTSQLKIVISWLIVACLINGCAVTRRGQQEESFATTGENFTGRSAHQVDTAGNSRKAWTAWALHPIEQRSD